jgi:hypothetical protein
MLPHIDGSAGRLPAVQPSAVAGGPHLNATKHGLYSESILLPGDDASEYRRQRLALFRTYRPQTEDEAELVDTLAEFRWLRQRCRPVQARFDAHMAEPAADAAGRVCEPIAHQRLHSSMDATVHRQRIERLWHRARAKLLELQKLRRLGLIEGAVKLPPGCYLDSSGEVAGPVPARVPCQVYPPAAPVAVSGLGDGEFRNSGERKES